MGTVVESDIRNDQENNYSKFNNVNINLRDELMKAFRQTRSSLKIM